jgi:hypothetical protein
MGWTNLIDSVKPTQSNPKKVGWVGLFGGYGFQNEKSIKKLSFGQYQTQKDGLSRVIG